MIRLSLISSLFSATLHGGIMAAVALNAFEGEMSLAPTGIRVIFAEPSVDEMPVQRSSMKKLQDLPLKKENAPKLPVLRSTSPEEIYSSPRINTDHVTEVEYAVEGFANPLPKYPLVARKRGHEGQVMVRVHVSEVGQIININLIKSSRWDDLDQMTLETLESWQFKPATRAGTPIAGSVDLTFTYQLSVGKVNLN